MDVTLVLVYVRYHYTLGVSRPKTSDYTRSYRLLTNEYPCSGDLCEQALMSCGHMGPHVTATDQDRKATALERLQTLIGDTSWSRPENQTRPERSVSR